LAEAAKPSLGEAGLVLIAIGAILSTASAINATLYGASRLSYSVARDGELPTILERKIWGRPIEGLLITAALTLLVANLLDLTSISTVGSSGFLVIFAAVNLAGVRHARRTHSRWWFSAVGTAACLGALGALTWQTAQTDPRRLWILAGLVGTAALIEGSFQLAKRQIRLR